MDHITNKFISTILTLQFFFRLNNYPAELSRLIVAMCYELYGIRMYIYSESQVQICIDGRIYLSDTKNKLNPNFPDEYIQKISQLKYYTIYLGKYGKAYFRYSLSENSHLICSQFRHEAEFNDDIIDIANGDQHSLFLSTKREVYACNTGIKNYGQLGTISDNQKKFVIHKTNLTNITKVFAGGDSSFAISNSGGCFRMG